MNFWGDDELTDSSSVVIRSYFQVDNETLLPFFRDFMLSLTPNTLPDGITREELVKEIDAEIAKSYIQVKMEQFSATEIDLASGWTIQWWNERRTTITTDEGETQTVEKKQVTIADP